MSTGLGALALCNRTDELMLRHNKLVLQFVTSKCYDITYKKRKRCKLASI